jgi:hypothetical protein
MSAPIASDVALPCASLFAATRGALFGPIPVAQVRVALPRLEAAS